MRDEIKSMLEFVFNNFGGNLKAYYDHILNSTNTSSPTAKEPERA